MCVRIPALNVVLLDVDGVRILSVPKRYVKHHRQTDPLSFALSHSQFALGRDLIARIMSHAQHTILVCDVSADRIYLF